MTAIAAVRIKKQGTTDSTVGTCTECTCENTGAENEGMNKVLCPDAQDTWCEGWEKCNESGKFCLEAGTHCV